MQDPNKPAILRRKVYWRNNRKYLIEDVSDVRNSDGKYVLFVRVWDGDNDETYYITMYEDKFNSGYEDAGWEDEE